MNKVTNIISVIIGIIGIIIGLYFHYSIKEEKTISYHLNAESYKIFDNKNTNGLQKLTLYKEDSIKIKQDVFLTTFSIWNSGNMPINTIDIRKELIINLSGVENILESKIIKEITSGISEFKISQTSTSSFNLKWKYFDPKDGTKFQLLYIGKPNISATIKGKILKTEIKEFKSLKDKPNSIYGLFLGPLILIYLMVISISFFKGRAISPFDGIEKISFINDNLISGFNKGIKIFMFIMFILYLVAIPLYYYRYFYDHNIIPL